MNLEQVALEVADDLNEIKKRGLSFKTRDEVIDDYAIRFAKALITRLTRDAVPAGCENCIPIMYIHPMDIGRYAKGTLLRESDEQLPLFLHHSPAQEDNSPVPDWSLHGFVHPPLTQQVPAVCPHCLCVVTGIPDGWVLVPNEPTEEMLEAGWSAYRDSNKPAPFNMLADGFRAMIAAAPKEESCN